MRANRKIPLWASSALSFFFFLSLIPRTDTQLVRGELPKELCGITIVATHTFFSGNLICFLQMERRRNLQPARSPVAFGRGHRYVLSAAPAATHRRDYLSSHKSAGEIEASPYKAGHLLFLLLYSIPKGRRRRRRNITLWTSQSTCKFTCKSNSKSAEIWRERERKRWSVHAVSDSILRDRS